MLSSKHQNQSRSGLSGLLEGKKMKKVICLIAITVFLTACNPDTDGQVEMAKIKIGYETFHIPIPYILHIDDRRSKRLPFIHLMVKAPDLEIIDNMDQYIADKNRTPEMMTFGIVFDKKYKEKDIALSTLQFHRREYGLELPDFSKVDGLIELGTHGTNFENLQQTIYAYVENGTVTNSVTCFTSIKPEKDRCSVSQNYLEAHSFKARFHKKYLDWYFAEGQQKLKSMVESWRK